MHFPTRTLDFEKTSRYLTSIIAIFGFNYRDIRIQLSRYFDSIIAMFFRSLPKGWVSSTERV